MSENKSLLEKWSTKNSILTTGGTLNLTSSLLSTKSSLSSTGSVKSKCLSGGSSLGTGASISPRLDSSLTSKLANSLLGSSKPSSKLLVKPTLSSSFTKLTLQNERQTPSLLTTTRSSFIRNDVTSVIHSPSKVKTLDPSKINAKSLIAKKTAPSRKRVVKSGDLIVKKKIVETSGQCLDAQTIKRYTVEAPQYCIKIEGEENEEEDCMFMGPECEEDIIALTVGKSLADMSALKRGFINSVSGSLIAQPNLKDKDDPTRHQLLQHMHSIELLDPEFTLKVALYSRKELNIRTTSNFLLAAAASMDSSRQYLKKYFSAAIALPSDWIEVAEIFQTLGDNKLRLGSLPAALRKAMITKFGDFDEYQLAKYNKESSGKKKKKKESSQKNRETGKGQKTSGRDGHTNVKGKSKGRGGFFESDSSDSEDEGEEKTKCRRIFDRQGCGSISHDEKDSDEVLRKQRFTIKQLIRKLHIIEPVQYVMSIIGKKYPLTSEEFYQKRLPGTFDETRAGKRMKLAVPETWETQVSLKGNKAKTWEDLLDHKKLPFMAMLRNLRNLIKAGISPKHHNNVLRRLTDQRSVINSKQFPFRFFSAYAALNDLEAEYEKNQHDLIESATDASKRDFGVMRGGVQRRGNMRGRGGRGGPGRGGRGRGGRGRGGKESTTEWWVWKKQKKQEEGGAVKEVSYDKNLIQRYRKALDTAVKIATVHNVQPIKGRTILLCDLNEYMDTPCSSARGLGKPRTLKEISVLMGLMCKYSCEECEFIVFNDYGYQDVQLQPGTILDNMDTVINSTIPEKNKDMAARIPYAVLLEKLRDRVEIDNLLVFGDDFDPRSRKGQVVGTFLKNYRHMVNPNILYVSANFSAPKPGFSLEVKPDHHNDIYISGYSDALLRFVAERGSSGQVNHVDKIDTAFNLRPMPHTVTLQGNLVEQKRKALQESLQARNNLPPLLTAAPTWRTIRVFISSTFLDMHGERDLLTRFVFPELRSLARQKFVNVYEVDLRWGITEEQSKDNRALEVCLHEVSQCQLFIGLLGERYGWTPSSYQVPDSAEFDWVRDYPSGASVTELEMHLGALSKVDQAKDTAFFFFRDETFEKDVPDAFKSHFKTESQVQGNKLAALKQKIRKSGLEVFDSYPCHWGGCVSGKPIVSGLEEFGSRVLGTLVNAIDKLCPEEEAVMSEEENVSNMQWAYVESLSADFVGRKSLIDEINSEILKDKIQSNILGLVGKHGTGKTALTASTVVHYSKLKQVGGSFGVFLNFAGSAPGSNSLEATVRRLAYQLKSRFSLTQSLPQDFKNLVIVLQSLLEEAAEVCPGKLVIFLDGIDAMDIAHQPSSLEWLPSTLSDNVMVVITAVEGGLTHKSLKRLSSREIVVPGLEMWDKAELVRQTLAKHRKILNESGFGNQMKFLMLKKEASNPLYLKLACEELRVFGVFEKITDKLKDLPHTTLQMLQVVLTRLEEDHGIDNVSSALCLLITARNGLSHKELYDLMNWTKALNSTKFELSEAINLDVEQAQAITPMTFTYLVRSIAGFLTPSMTWSPVLSLANREVCAAVKQRYMTNPDMPLALHKLLASYFMKEADPLNNRSWKSKNVKAFVELPYHLTAAVELRELEKTLCDHSFIQAKCGLGLAAKLLEDFSPQVTFSNKVQEKMLTNFQSLQRVKEYKAFVSRNIEVLTGYPMLEWQQAMNEPSNTLPFKDATSNAHAISLHKAYPYMEWVNKPEEASKCMLTLANFKMPSTCVSVSPCGKMFATGSQDMLVRIYNMDTGKELVCFTGHSDIVTDVCFVGSSMLCSASADSTLSVWSVENHHRIATLKGHGRRVNSCAASPHGKFIASGAWDCTVIVWKTAAPFDKMCTLVVGSPVNSVDFHPSLEQVVVGTWDSLIRIYNYFHKTRIAVLRGHSTSVRDLAYSFDGRHLASAAMDGDIKLWAADKGSQVGNIHGHCGPINKLTFSANGRELITAGEDQQIKIWSGTLGVPLHCMQSDKLGAATAVSISPSGLTLAAGYHLGCVTVHDINTGAKLCKVTVCPSPVRSVTFSTNGAYILAGADDATVYVLQAEQGSKVCCLEGCEGSVLCVTTSKTYIAVGTEAFICCIYENLNKLKSVRRSRPSVVLRGAEGPITSCTFNADETMLATASRDASVRIYKLRDIFLSDEAPPYKVINACHADWINSCQWSNTGPYLVTASNDFNLKLFDTKTATEKLTLTGHTSAVNCVGYKYGCIVSGSSDGNLRVWSHKGTPITTLHGHTLRVNACDIFVKCNNKVEDEEEEELNWADQMEKEGEERKPVRRQKEVNLKDVIVASAGDDGAVWVWKPLQANNLAVLAGHSNRVMSVAVDKQQQVVSCSLDRSVRVWQPDLPAPNEDTEDCRESKLDSSKQTKHDGPITFMAVAPDGSLAISGSRDGTVKVWTKNNDEKFTVSLILKAHEKSVNCGCFSVSQPNVFYTGGDDNCVYTWKIIGTKVSLYIRKQDSIEKSMPIASILSLPNQELCFSTWNGKIYLHGPSRTSCSIYNLNKDEEDSNSIADYWTCSLTNDESRPDLIIHGSTDGYVGCFQLAERGESGVNNLFETRIAKSLPHPGENDNEKYENRPLWISAVLFIKEGATLVGDSEGRFHTIENKQNIFQIKIHTDAVTALDISRSTNTLISASMDKTVKVWTISYSRSYSQDSTFDIKQIGQFFCPSPVTTLKVAKTNHQSDLTILAGDLLGNIHQFKWHAI